MALTLVLAVLEGERGDHDGGVQVTFTTDLCAMQTIKDLAGVCSEGGKDFRTAAAHGHEATMIVVDNSESSRNGDYVPSRWDAQADAANLIFQYKTQANPESSVGLMTMGGV